MPAESKAVRDATLPGRRGGVSVLAVKSLKGECQALVPGFLCSGYLKSEPAIPVLLKDPECFLNKRRALVTLFALLSRCFQFLPHPF